MLSLNAIPPFTTAGKLAISASGILEMKKNPQYIERDEVNKEIISRSLSATAR